MPTPRYDMNITPEEVAAADTTLQQDLGISATEYAAAEASIGATGDTAGARTGTGPGQTPANPATPWLNLAGTTIHASAELIATVLNSGTALELERLRGAAETRKHQILLDIQNAGAPERLAALRLQALALQQTINATNRPPPQSNTLLYVGIGGVALLAIGTIVYVAMTSKRHNPVVRRRRR